LETAALIVLISTNPERGMSIGSPRLNHPAAMKKLRRAGETLFAHRGKPGCYLRVMLEPPALLPFLMISQ